MRTILNRWPTTRKTGRQTSDGARRVSETWPNCQDALNSKDATLIPNALHPPRTDRLVVMDTKRPTVPEAEEILGGYFPVLDHGFVALVDYMGTDQDIERAARVSYGAGTRKVSQTRGLIRYLQRHAHTTPSEMVEFKFHCCMPMFVARQWVRHRTASVNELSARYSLLPLLFYRPEQANFAHQSSVNNQGREPEPAPTALYREAVERWDALRDRLGGRLRLAARGKRRPGTGAHRPAPVHLYPVVLEDRPAQPAALPDAARRRPRAVGDSRVRSRDGRDAQARGPARLRGVAGLQRPRHALERRRTRGAGTTPQGGGGRLGGARRHTGLSRRELGRLGLAGREIRELLAKIEAPERPDFSLDLADMRDAAEIEAEMDAAVPVVDRREV